MTWYAKGFAGAGELRGQLSVIETVAQGLGIIDRAIDQLINSYEVVPEPEMNWEVA
jgi:tRNA-dihydrouridine synthase B